MVTSRSPELSFARLCRARDMLREIHEPPLTVAQLARDAGISRSHFIRQFHALFGETPHQFRLRERFDHAKHLLVLGEHSVTEVCLDVGFSSLGSFSSVFAARVGMPPSAYRRAVRASVTVRADLPRLLFPGCLTLMADAFALFEKRRGHEPCESSPHENKADKRDGR